ncbi:MAG TPA: hypothetical protein VJ599_10335 [Nitrososphaeraceae archaeon]|nr:hypothetical protein [Nitrososphaeraceae archaeon]
MKDEIARLNEWYVPQFGPIRFRIFVGMLFLPYTGMCISFAIIGSLLSPSTIAWDRVLAIIIIYFTALGISAHAADSMGSRTKPWGNRFSSIELLIMVVGGLIVAYGIGTYYILYYVPLLLPIAILEGFFLFAYNYELWNGFFHSNIWFAVSWGSMPLLAGYIMQTNSLSYFAILISVVTFLVSYVEIRLSRKYKQTKKNHEQKCIRRLELKLKLVSITTILFSVMLLFFKAFQITF